MIRTATAADLELVRELFGAFEAEVSDLPWRDDDSAEDLAATEREVGEGNVLLAADDGFAVVSMHGSRRGCLDLLYVRPEDRGRGVAAELVRAAAQHLRERGAEYVELEVLERNDAAVGLYGSLGFETVERILAAPVERLLAEDTDGPTFGLVHVQTDDVDAVARNAQKVMPRLGDKAGASVGEVSNGWVAVRSAVTDRDPAKLRTLAQELSYASGGVALALGVESGAVVRYVLFDRGSMVDEYASVPEFHGPLPPGEVIALRANPTVVARLTGASPQRVRDVVRTAASPSELPPALELYEAIAELLGVEVN